MKITWHGTASIEIESNGEKLLFDPFVPLKGAQWKKDISDYDGFDSILLTHGHIDHIVNIPEIIDRNKDTLVYCTGTPYSTLIKKGVPPENLCSIAGGSQIRIGNFEIEIYDSRHAVLPKRSFERVLKILFNKNAANLPFIISEHLQCPENDETVMYQVKAEGKSVVIMGSLNLREAITYPQECDVLLLPYNGWDDNLPPSEMVINRLHPKKVLLTHWDNTFPPLTGNLDITPVLEKYPDLILNIRINESIEI